MSDTAPVPPDHPSPVSAIDVGDWVYVLYWRAFPMPDNPNNGSWESNLVRVVSVGAERMTGGIPVCIEVSPTTPADHIGDGSVWERSPFRYVDQHMLFRSSEEALVYAALSKTLKKPNQ